MIRDRARSAPEMAASALLASAWIIISAFWEALDWLSFLILLYASSSALIYLLGAFQFGAPSPELSCAAQALEHLSLHCPIDVDAMST